MIMEYYGGYMDLEDIQELFHTDKTGTRAFDMVEGAKKIGFFAKGVRCPVDSFLNEDIICPCIANVTLHSTYSHFVVIYEINKRKKEIVVADPANKIMKMKLEIFKSIYTNNLLLFYPERPLVHFTKKKMTWQEIKKILLGSKKLIFQIFLLSIFIMIYVVITSFYSEKMLKGLESNREDFYLIFLFLVFLIFTILKITSEFFRNKLFIWLDKKMDIILNEDTFFRVLFLPYQYYHNHTTGDIVSRIQGLDNIKAAISKWIIVIMIDIPLMIITFSCLMFLHLKLAFLILLFFLLEFVLISIFRNTLEVYIENCQKENAILTNIEVESVRSFETVKGISIEDYFKRKIIKEKVHFLKEIHKLEDIVALENYGKDLIQQISFLTLLLVGCLSVRQGNLTFSSLLTIQSLSNYFYMPLEELIALERDTKQAKIAWSRISIFQKEVKKGYLKNRNIKTIFFKNVCYSYRADKEILHHITLKIRKGEKILVLGPSGSGKSTLFKLLKGYYEIPRGMILIDELDMHDYEDLRFISYINQTETLYTGSLLENLSLDSNPSDDYLKKIVKICCIDEIATKTSLGYYQLIEENGINLSGGERQRIVLARTLLRPFEILIIDEGLNQVDVDLERKILKGVFKEFYDKTIIVISHREENVDLFRRKIKICQGRINEDLTKNGNY